MRTLFIIFTVIAAVLALVLSILPLSNLAFILAGIAIIFGVIAFHLSNKQDKPNHTVKLAFLLTIIAISFSTYKALFNSLEVGNTEQLQETDKKSEIEALEKLKDLDLEYLNLEENDLEEIDIHQ
ncbi:FUSC family protein [Bizionia argentinensis JUB59]|uniref:FUSC family protein n=1 Tax=Bizionia argentinensis JUB59 TaxID=1046627 RepID=G2ECJ4_9FLAO|nr:FUSC family protein [Bizionia argentinensis]EGV43850.1 FUSC family protein [Bizionia argentinensis JUB59]